MAASAALLLVALQQVPAPERGARVGDVEQSLRRLPEFKPSIPPRLEAAAAPAERVGRVLVDGPRAGFILGFFDGFEPPERLDLDELERRLLLLNDVPGLRVDATLGPGGAPGETDIHLESSDEGPVKLWAGYDNHGAENVGRHRGTAKAEFRDLWHEGHRLAVQGARALGASERDLEALRLDYAAPGAGGVWIRAHAAAFAYAADRERTALEPSGDGLLWGVSVEQALRRSSAFSCRVGLGVEWKRLVQEQLHIETSRDELAAALLDLRLEGRGWRVSLGLAQGMGEDDEDPSRAGAEGDWRAGRLRAEALQPLGLLSLYGRLEAQWAVEPLAVSELFALGGPDRVRGYPAFEATGERGYAATAEAQLHPAFLVPDGPPWDTIQLAAFLDAGEAVVERPAPGERRARVFGAGGVGVRVDAPGLLSLRADLAVPLSEADPSNGEDWAAYLSVTLEIR